MIENGRVITKNVYLLQLPNQTNSSFSLFDHWIGSRIYPTQNEISVTVPI
jgi:hypothetical protein